MIALQELKCTPGIYTITCLGNDRVYVGQSVNLRKRFREHKRELSKGIHRNQHLQYAYNKHGANTFVFDIIATAVDRFELNKYEVWYMDVLHSLDPKLGFNICSDPNGFWYNGRTIPDETRQKLSAAMTGRHLPEAVRKKIGESHRGKTMSQEARQKISEANKNRAFSATTRQRISEAKKNVPVGSEHRAAIEESMMNSGLSDTLTFQGQTRTYKQWSRRVGLDSATIYQRIKRGWAPEKALTEPTKRSNSGNQGSNPR